MSKNPTKNPLSPTQTLDPENWESFKEEAHKALEEALDYLKGLREREPWKPVPDSARAALSAPVPMEASPFDQVMAEFREHVFPYPLGNIHSRHWGWVNGTGTADGVVSEMLSATMNSNITGHDQSPILVEKQILEWFKTLFEYPESAGGLMVSGGTMANLTALVSARAAKAGFEVREEGLGGKNARQFTLYTSSEAHYCIARAADILGFGKKACRSIPVLEDFTIDLKALEDQIREDRAKGFTPLAIIGNAGTVNTGAIDPLEALFEVARREDLWFHVDGAYGAVAWFSKKLKSRLKGMEKADSIAFDLHKWLYQPYGTGCVLVRSGRHLNEAFSLEASYFKPLTRGISKSSLTFNDIGIEHSRRFRALAFWVSLKTHGLKKFQALLEQNVNQARFLADLIQKAPDLELTSPVNLNVVTFRYNPGGLSEDALNNLNRSLLMEIQTRGIAVPSSTILNGAFVLRAAIVNHRSRPEDFEALVKAAREIGRELA